MHDAAFTVHIACRNWLGVRDRVHDERKQRPDKENYICDEADRTEPEGAMGDVVAAADQKADYWNRVAKIEHDDTGCDHTAHY
jgi:hypothetical protein